jgi:ferrous iron transport protein B
MVSDVLSRPCTIALVGNPNTGKSTLFNALSGLRQRVGNYPGVTVELKKGFMTADGWNFTLVDLPGTYSLAPRSPDEMVAVDLLLGQQAGEARPDVVVSLVDASNLDRNLYLTTQILELGIPVVVALNMIDLAEGQGVRVDAEELSRRLGVPVVPIQANRGRGLDRLREAITAAADADAPPCGVTFPEAFEREATQLREALGEAVPEFLVRRVLLDVGGYTEQRLAARHEGVGERVAAARQRLAADGCGVPTVEARARYGWIRRVTDGCVRRPLERPVTWTDRVDAVLTHRLWGTLVFLLLMFGVFQAIFTGARPLMGLIGDAQDRLTGLVGSQLPAGPVRSLLTDGVIAGVGGVVVFLPQIVILFGFLAVLEDCGYMARAAFLMDKVMSRAGLSGKSFIPLLSSMACAVPGILAARVIEDRRDRLATILVAPLMSCSARLPVYILLIGAFLTAGFPWWLPGLVMFAMYLVGLIAAPLMALLLKRTLLRGETPVFVMEMPLYRWPSLFAIGRRMFDAAGSFLYRAGTMILATMVLVWALLYFPSTDGQGQSYDLRTAAMEEEAEQLRADGDEDRADEVESEAKRLRGEWKRGSVLGRMGRAIEPAVRPLGWDWRLGMAALASFPAREVVVGTLGVIYDQGDVDAGEVSESPDVADTPLARAMVAATWDDEPSRKVFTVPTALSLMVFFALCCQCVSTLAVIRRETRSWRWPLFTFAYMTALAYVGALIVYQAGALLGG